MVAKPDKRAGSASKAVGIERCGVQVLWLSPYGVSSRGVRPPAGNGMDPKKVVGRDHGTPPKGSGVLN